MQPAWFVDNQGRKWTVSITVADIKRVKAALDVDLGRLSAGKLDGVAALFDDPAALCDVLFVLCRREADAAGVDDESFGRAMAGDAIEHASLALVRAVADFCPSRLKPAILAMAGKMRAAMEVADSKAGALLAAVEAIDPAAMLAAPSGSVAASPPSPG